MLVDLIQNVSDVKKSRTFQGLGHGLQEELGPEMGRPQTTVSGIANSEELCYQHTSDRQGEKSKR